MTDLLDKLKKLEALGVPIKVLPDDHIWIQNANDEFDGQSVYVGRLEFFKPSQYLIIGCIVEHMRSLGFVRSIEPIEETDVRVSFTKSMDQTNSWISDEFKATIHAALAALEG